PLFSAATTGGRGATGAPASLPGLRADGRAGDTDGRIGRLVFESLAGGDLHGSAPRGGVTDESGCAGGVTVMRPRSNSVARSWTVCATPRSPQSSATVRRPSILRRVARALRLSTSSSPGSGWLVGSARRGTAASEGTARAKCGRRLSSRPRWAGRAAGANLVLPGPHGVSTSNVHLPLGSAITIALRA